MFGHLRSQELPIYGAKTLAVRNGTLEMHGKPIDNTWTLLAETANAGDTQVILQYLTVTLTRHKSYHNLKLCLWLQFIVLIIF